MFPDSVRFDYNLSSLLDTPARGWRKNVLQQDPSMFAVVRMHFALNRYCAGVEHVDYDTTREPNLLAVRNRLDVENVEIKRVKL